MDNIIVYIDDAAYALAQLQPMQLTGHGTPATQPTHWVLVTCAPRLTRHASKWVSPDACKAWRQRWADMAFATIVPALQSRGDTVETVVAGGPLHGLTADLSRRFGPARIMDARRPKFGHRLPTVSATQGLSARNDWQLPLALASMGAMLTLVGD